MRTSHWHKLYRSRIRASSEQLFDLTSDLPRYGRWLPASEQFGEITDVEPDPVQLGSRYHDGKPTTKGRDWWGSVIGFAPPKSLDFHQTIKVSAALATVDVFIHYSFESHGDQTDLTRWLVLDISMPFFTRPLRGVIIRGFDKENVRTMAALKEYAERHPS